MRHCGCKSSTFIQLYKPFLKVFSKYFLTNWFFDIYNSTFLWICDFEMGIFGDLDSFEGFWGGVSLFRTPTYTDSLCEITDNNGFLSRKSL